MIFSKLCFSLITLALVVTPLRPETLPCKIPVFRYALENWLPAPYEVVIVHRGTLSEDAKTLVDKMEAKASGSKTSVNLEVKSVNVEEDVESELLTQVLGSEYRNSIGSPEIILLYPAESQSGPLAWRGPLTAENVDALFDSPARTQITEWILEGESVVWVLIGGGDSEKDETAERLVRTELARLEKELVMRDIEVIESEKQYGTDTKVELRLGIKLLVLDRKDPSEKIFASTITNSEDDLDKLGEPIVMPVFGRGRAYLSLAGKGINPKMLEATCRFLIADCSCEVKRLNPGVDLLFSVDWDGLIVGTASSDESLPVFTGDSVYVDIPPGNTAQNKSEVGVLLSADETEPKTLSGRNWMVWLAGLVFFGIAVIAISTRLRS